MGTITDENGESLPGVNVIEKGTANGTISNVEGDYSIQVDNENAILVFSSVGYSAEEVTVGQQTKIDVQMATDIQALDEVVVVGYGTVKEKDLIASVSKIDAEAIQRTNNASFTSALQGNATGVQVVSSSGEPNADARILIRGVNSITAGTEPLILVDGLPVSNGGTNPLAYINPQDIESISVLKDAAATAIYGSRGANGVILITTKTGQQGVSEINFSYETGVTTPINSFEMTNADEWRELVALARANSGLTERFLKETDLFDQRQQQRYVDLDVYNTGDTDWEDLMSQNGRINTYTVSASNGTERSSYYLSGQYRGQEGNMVDTKFERYTARVNLDFKPADFLKVGVRYTFIYNDDKPRHRRANSVTVNDPRINQGARPTFGALYGSALPIHPVYWPDDGSPFDPLSGNNLVVADADSNALRTYQDYRNLGTGFLEIEPVKGLILRAEVGANYATFRDNTYSNLRAEELRDEDLVSDRLDTIDYIYEDGIPRWNNEAGTQFSYNINATASYTASLGRHNLSALVGVERNYSRGDNVSYDFEGVASPQDPFEIGFVNDGSALIGFSNDVGDEIRFASTFGRFTYNFDDRYYFQGSLRYDGSSKFSPEDRFSWFPAAAVGWVLSEESFWNVSVLNYLKFRAGFGVTGNSAIPAFQYFDSFLPWPRYPNGQSGAFVLGNLGAGRIQWEKSNTFDAAIDFGLLDDRVSGSFGYYHTRTTDMLLNFPTARSIGGYWRGGDFSALANVGSMENYGIELEITSRNLNLGAFNWTTTLNFTTNKNRVVDLYPGFDGNPDQLSFNGRTVVLEGEPIGQFFLPVFAGLDDSGNVLVKEVDQELREDNIFEFTGNDVRNTGPSQNNNRVIQEGKTGIPTWFGGLTNAFSYKGFSLSVLFTFQGGHYIYDGIGRDRAGTGRGVFRKDLVGNTWSESNPDAEYAVLTWGNLENNPEDPNVVNSLSTVSTQFLEKGDMVRLRNINFRYDFQPGLLENINFIKRLGVYVNLENVATFSQFDTIDPEFVTLGSAADRNIGQGVLGGIPYWQVFSATAGVNITF